MQKTVKDGWAEVEGLRIHYFASGERREAPVLLLHGGGFDSASLSYKHAIGPISEHYRTLAPDWPGYGQSDKPKIEYTTEYYVGFLGRLMDTLGLERASLVGISMGGAISLGFTLRSPQRVEKLVLVDSHGLGGEVPGGGIIRVGSAAAPQQAGVGCPQTEPQDGGAELADRFLRSRGHYGESCGRGPPTGEETGGGASLEIVAKERDHTGRPPHELCRQAPRIGGADADPPRG